MKKRIAALLIAVLLLGLLPAGACAEEPDGYTLDRVVVLSRHNIRSPLSGIGSLLGDITPHEWFNWTIFPPVAGG